jgi:ribosomal protein S18 acetylase RimI-like enzyme
LQVLQKQGAGQILMRMLTQLALHYHMRKTSLTVFKNNQAAMAFYKKIGFVVDSNSPSNFGCPDECYEILSDRNF